MYQAGFPVPEGFVICANTFGRFMEENGLWDKVYEKSLISTGIPGKASRRQARKSGNGVVGADVQGHGRPDRQPLFGVGGQRTRCGTLKRHGGGSGRSQFRGQQATFLYVVGTEEVIRFVKECWASLYNDSAIFYRKEKKFDERDISIAVVVMRMVNPKKRELCSQPTRSIRTAAAS
jgi:pyruvate,water dikinase